MQYLHDNGVVHGDLKAANVMLVAAAGEQQQQRHGGGFGGGSTYGSSASTAAGMHATRQGRMFSAKVSKRVWLAACLAACLGRLCTPRRSSPAGFAAVPPVCCGGRCVDACIPAAAGIPHMSCTVGRYLPSKY